tara:strand:- start:57 stop:803 length:747 start_codon:yes stop_codon:yes gene_type:complete
MAYKQNAGRDDLRNLSIEALTNGGTDPTDPKPNGVVASSDDLTFGGGVTNELEGVTLKTVKNTKPKVNQSLSLRDSILNNTADDSYSMYNANTKKTTNQIVDPISGTNFDQTNYSSPLTDYKASTISGNKSVATSSNTWPNTNQYSMTAKSPYAATASNMVGRTPSTAQDGFQETYSDGDFVRNTKTGKQQSSVPRKGKINTPTQINQYNKHLKDSTLNRNVRVREQVKNEQLKDRASLLKDLINKNK